MSRETLAEAESESSQKPSATSILSEVFRSLGLLLRSELELAQAEVRQNLERTKTAFGLLVLAIVFSTTAFMLLAGALVFALAEWGLGVGWAALVVGISLAIIAFFLARKGLYDLKSSSLAPTRTAKNLKRDAKAIKETYDD